MCGTKQLLRILRKRDIRIRHNVANTNNDTMKRYRTLVKLISGALLILLLSTTYVHAGEEHEVEDETTCSLNPSKGVGNCATDEPATSSPERIINFRDLTRQVIPISDETFDKLTLTSEPSTWLIMFKTDSCGLCKKAKPVLESLVVDADIISHNDEQTKETGNVGNVVVGDRTGDDEYPPRGAIYIGTIDASSWTGRDTTKRFGVDSTPLIILIRNEGFSDAKEETRSYYVYRGHREVYALRKFVFGEFASRKRLEMPPPLSEKERKKSGVVGRLFDYLLLPSVKWAGTIVGKIIFAWIVFISLLGLFLRVHNYAWGENADDNNNEEDIEKEKAKGRAEFEEDKNEIAKRRQQIMWERKRANHEKFKKKKEAAAPVGRSVGVVDDDLHGLGKSVKKSDALKTKAATKQKKK